MMFLKKLWQLPRNILIAIIRLYQKSLSPDHGWPRSFFPDGYCRFHPTCSQYAVESLQQHGLFIGFFKSLWRIMRCNPCSGGGDDPVI